MRKVKILVSGRVQGVYFRLFTQNKAKHFGIKGSAKNLADGRVEIIAEAGSLAIEKFIKWCHKGPITARVDHVEITELEPGELLTSFEVK
ncbi:acylphosphatase [Methylobacter tundripaludum]|uniref:acylphosphatase n=1 Tax=Methylobacter tundripaludum TaxID=173365 RepID=A0A2S6GGV1_9GAMM|nr:acylphosphatase [Methylobacter tundripaludum]PPK64429.1 acylphosphatase [Methylobacter tundripaludum]